MPKTADESDAMLESRRHMIQRELDIRSEFASQARKMEARIKELEKAEKELRVLRKQKKLLETEKSLESLNGDADENISLNKLQQVSKELCKEVEQLRLANRRLQSQNEQLHAQNEELQMLLLESLKQAVSNSPLRASSRPGSRQSVTRVAWDLENEQERPPEGSLAAKHVDLQRELRDLKLKSEGLKSAIKRPSSRHTSEEGMDDDFQQDDFPSEGRRYNWTTSDASHSALFNSLSRSSTPSVQSNSVRRSSPSPTRLSPSRRAPSQRFSSVTSPTRLFSDYTNKVPEYYSRSVAQQIRNVTRPPRVHIRKSTGSISGSEDEIATAVKELSMMFSDVGIGIPIRQLQGNTYLIGDRKVQLYIRNRKLLVHTGGGSLSIWTYLSNLQR
mmetsp:Transcript_354/g.607  ORF Transcript_354/g.607 Transcript_354/m.607 type:complete len:388 (-) Transcript_354:137-1300(-)